MFNEQAVQQTDNETLKKLSAKERLLQPMSASFARSSLECVSDLLPEGELRQVLTRQNSPLSLLLAQGSKKRHPDAIVFSRPGHGRTAIVKEAECEVAGVSCPYIEVKGLGYIVPVSNEYRDRTSKKRRKLFSTLKVAFAPYSARDVHARVQMDPLDMRGFAELSWIEQDFQVSSFLLERGVPVVPVIAIRRLHQVMDPDGALVSLEEARSRELISPEIQPAIVYRAYPVPFRMQEIQFIFHDLAEGDDIVFGQKKLEFLKEKYLSILKLLQDVDDVPNEVKRSLSDEQLDKYFEWLFQRIGRSVGIMNTLGIAHVFLGSMHNITIDRRLLDFDTGSVSEFDETKMKEDEKLFYNRVVNEEITLPPILHDLIQYQILAYGPEHGFTNKKNSEYFVDIARNAYEEALREN